MPRTRIFSCHPLFRRFAKELLSAGDADAINEKHKVVFVQDSRQFYVGRKRTEGEAGKQNGRYAKTIIPAIRILPSGAPMASATNRRSRGDSLRVQSCVFRFQAPSRIVLCVRLYKIVLPPYKNSRTFVSGHCFFDRKRKPWKRP